MFGNKKNRILHAAGLITEGNLDKMRIEVAKELSQMQRVGEISVKTDAVERTMNGEFDKIIKYSLAVRDAASSLADLLG